MIASHLGNPGWLLDDYLQFLDRQMNNINLWESKRWSDFNQQKVQQIETNQMSNQKSLKQYNIIESYCSVICSQLCMICRVTDGKNMAHHPPEKPMFTWSVWSCANIFLQKDRPVSTRFKYLY